MAFRKEKFEKEDNLQSQNKNISNESKCKCNNKNCECEENHSSKNKFSSENNHKFNCENENCKCDKNENNTASYDIDTENDCESSHCDEMQEAMNYLELAQRVQAEFDNYRKRTQNVEKEAKQKGIVEAVEKLLPIIDSIDNAKRQIKDQNFLSSLNLIDNQIMQCFKNLGVEKIEAVGKPFNPNFHNAIMCKSIEGSPPDMVVDEFQAGFRLGDKIIRHSVVKVSK